MDKSEAKQLIAKELNEYRAKSYEEFILLIDKASVTYELKGANGVNYQIEIQAFWDNKKNGNVRVAGAIDDGGLRALAPFSDDFIKSPSGKYIGE